MTRRRQRGANGQRRLLIALSIGMLLLASTQLSLAGGSDPGDMPPAPQQPVTLTNPTTGEPITLTPEIPHYANSGAGTPSNPLTGGLVSSPPVTVNPPSPGDPPPQPPAPPPPPPPTDPGGLQPPMQPITDPGDPTQPGGGLLKGRVSIGVPGTGDPADPDIPGHGTPGASQELQFWEGATKGAANFYAEEAAKLPQTIIQKLLSAYGPGWVELLFKSKEIAEKIKDVIDIIKASGKPVGGLTYATGYRLGQEIAKLVTLTNAGEIVGESE